MVPQTVGDGVRTVGRRGRRGTKWPKKGHLGQNTPNIKGWAKGPGVHHSSLAKNTRSQRQHTVLTPTARAPLDRTPSVHQLSTNLERTINGSRSTLQKRRCEVKKIKIILWLLGGYPSISQGPRSRLGEAEDEYGQKSEETELAGAPEASEATNLAHSNQPLVSQAEPNFLKMMEHIT
ncbi:hypothetical protein O181_006280 [Austropuccinia psidii MF-1]|uniref:Uncharacterized protein n=1 Tax=Austropuccinia psidii MF-1 TaxID=1389203 RepID=A0A9Q3BK31_9BASI|nr:hypothetical protein [Austropuccinia psidii MF-1]